MPEANGTPTPTATESAKGFVASLLDLSFTEFVTTRLVKVLYVLTLILTLFLYVAIAVSIFNSGESVSSFDRVNGQIVTTSSGGGDTGLGLLWLFVLGPLAILLYTLFYRVVCELIVVVFRIFEFNREQTELLRRMVPGDATPPEARSPAPPASQGPPPSWAPPPA